MTATTASARGATETAVARWLATHGYPGARTTPPRADD